MARPIPRKIHFIRINAPISKDEEILVVEWIRQNPAYEVFVWAEKQYVDDIVSALVQLLMEVETIQSMQTLDMQGGDVIQVHLSLDGSRELTFSVCSIWSVPAGVGELAFRHEMSPPKNIYSAVNTLKLRILYWFGGIYMGMNVATAAVIQPQNVIAPREVLFSMVPRGDCMELQDCIMAASCQSDKVKSLLTMVDARNKVIMVEPFPKQLMRDPDSAFSKWAKDNLADYQAKETWRHDVLKEAEGSSRSGVELLLFWFKHIEKVSLNILPETPPSVVDPRELVSSSSEDVSMASSQEWNKQSPEPPTAFETVELTESSEEGAAAPFLGEPKGVVIGRKQAHGNVAELPEPESAQRNSKIEFTHCSAVDIYLYSFQNQSQFSYWVMPTPR